MSELLQRAQGVLVGQFVGDSLGAQVEFSSRGQILKSHPEGVREICDGGYWGTLAGQPTDDSEMAMELILAVLEGSGYSQERARRNYLRWLASDPFDVGTTTRSGLGGQLKLSSQANGALMRVSPLGVCGVNFDEETVSRWAREDAMITHPHSVCLSCNVLFVLGIRFALMAGAGQEDVFEFVLTQSEGGWCDPAVREVVLRARHEPPADFQSQQGWVLVAFQNALYQLRNSSGFEEALVETVSVGGDTDTNGAIAGALLGGVFGVDGIPERWKEAVLNCRPDGRRLDVRRPRPERYWPVSLLSLAEELVTLGKS